MAATSAATGIALKDLRAVVGRAHAREAGDGDRIDGITPSFVVEPGSVEEAAAVLRHATSEGLAVVPRGSGTKMAIGNAPDRVDLVLSTARLNAILEHAAGDLVAIAQAGVRLADLQARLGAAGQMLALDPPEPGATLGGIVAANASGPRRLRYGTARDLLIGLTVVLSDGTVAKAGGRVVKNVAGYDLGKLFTGSFGTLGLIAEVTFRLHPRPAAVRSVEAAARTAAGAQAVAEAAAEPGLVPSAVELAWPAAGAPGMVTTRYEGIEPGVAAQATRLGGLLQDVEVGGAGGVGSAGATEVADLEPADVVVKIAHPPARLAAMLEAVWEVAASHGIAAAVTAHAASGVMFVGLSGADPEQVASYAVAVGELRFRAVAEGGSAVIVRAPAAVKGIVDAWGPAGDAAELMRRVKARFDPTRTMSPGRFVEGI